MINLKQNSTERMRFQSKNDFDVLSNVVVS
jgi:hypothetical protein